MLTLTGKKMIEDSRALGWVLEPDAKTLMKEIGLDVPKGVVTDSIRAAKAFFKEIEGMVVVKAVSGKILHKTEHHAVVLGIDTATRLESEMKRLLTLPGCEKIIVEEMVRGVEVIVGAKIDYQFGPVIVFGAGGTGVEIYNDTAIRLAPLKPADVYSMVDSLKAKEMLTGHRGAEGIDMERLARSMVSFSNLLMELEHDVESIDLNPVMCSQNRCVVADARIILNTGNEET